MNIYLIERSFDEPQTEATAEGVKQVLEVNAELGVEWICSYLGKEEAQSFCIYQAPNEELLREHAKCLAIPADRIVQVKAVSPATLDL